MTAEARLAEIQAIVDKAITHCQLGDDIARYFGKEMKG